MVWLHSGHKSSLSDSTLPCTHAPATKDYRTFPFQPAWVKSVQSWTVHSQATGQSGGKKMISNCPSQVVTWSTSCPPSFIDINTNTLVYDNGVLRTNFSHTDCGEKLEKIITGSNQLKGRGQGKFSRKWEVHWSIAHPHPQEPLVQPRMTVRHWHTKNNAPHPMPAASI